MNHVRCPLAAIPVMLAAVLGGCSSDAGTGENQDSVSLATSRGEHDRDGGEHGGEGYGEHGRGGEGEESGIELASNESYDRIRNGVRLILAYDAQSNSFNGTVENTTNRTLKRVRVEVHLSNGTELGPTTPADLAPGNKRDIKLPATIQAFDGWTAHPEVGSSEGGHGEERGEHDREGRGEHDEGGSD